MKESEIEQIDALVKTVHIFCNTMEWNLGETNVEYWLIFNDMRIPDEVKKRREKWM